MRCEGFRRAPPPLLPPRVPYWMLNCPPLEGCFLVTEQITVKLFLSGKDSPFLPSHPTSPGSPPFPRFWDWASVRESWEEDIKGHRQEKGILGFLSSPVPLRLAPLLPASA